MIMNFNIININVNILWHGHVLQVGVQHNSIKRQVIEQFQTISPLNKSRRKSIVGTWRMA